MLKTLFASAAVFFVTGIGGQPAQAQNEIINLVYDLQGVAITNQTPTPGFGEQLEIQLRDPRVRIHFFSSQSNATIERQLARIRLPNGLTAGQVARIFDGTMMGDRDRVPGSVSDEAQVLFKDLRVITTDAVEFANTILIDDADFMAHPLQSINLLWLPLDLGLIEENVPGVRLVVTEERKTSRPIYPQAFRRPSLRSRPVPRFVQVPIDRVVDHRSDLMLGLISAAITMSDRAHVSLSEALHRIQWGILKEGPAADFRLDNRRLQVAFMRHGARVRARAACSTRLAH